MEKVSQTLTMLSFVDVLKLRSLTKLVLSHFNLKLTKYREFNRMYNEVVRLREVFKRFPIAKRLYPFLSLVEESKSQIGQDIFVLEVLKHKRKGLFVDIGATNGKELSNTYMLEMKYDWHGICVEPGVFWHQSLKSNRHCAIDERCVWSESEKVLIFADSIAHENSTILEFALLDMHAKTRENHVKYEVQSVSLNDLLAEYKFPRAIDYISLDTEGSEFEILKTFNFEKYRVSVWTIEHNFTANRNLIMNLMISQGYVKVLSDISSFDDWYVAKELITDSFPIFYT